MRDNAGNMSDNLLYQWITPAAIGGELPTVNDYIEFAKPARTQKSERAPVLKIGWTNHVSNRVKTGTGCATDKSRLF